MAAGTATEGAKVRLDKEQQKDFTMMTIQY